MKKSFFVWFLIIIAFLLLSSCTKRSNPISPTYPIGVVYEQQETLSVALQGNLLNDPYKRPFAVYLPPDYKNFGIGEGYPVLFLLHEYKGDLFTFRDKYQIAKIADWLIGTGQIQKMIIVMADVSDNLGGSFCGNNALLGNYEEYIAQDIRTWIDKSFNTFATRVSGNVVWDANYPKYKAIAGVGMGGYGAFRIALADTNYKYFGAIGALNSPLAFNGDTTVSTLVPFNGGVLSWGRMVLDSNGIGPQGYGYHNINPRDNDRLTTMIFAMAAAFSQREPSHSSDPTFFQLTIPGWGAALPFDSLGDEIPDVWGEWRDHDIATRIQENSIPLTTLMKYTGKIYHDCGDANILNLQYQNRMFDKTLTSLAVDHTYIEYSGYTGYPAADVNFVADRLVELLKFFSAKFPPAPKN
jgi:S-formylglutathione hydrolase FrmB